MKAVILAGGEGTRLRPLTLLRPKPMLPLFDRPLLEHIVLLLRDNGFTDICMTLRYLPKVIQDWFGTGEDLGVRIEYRIESEPRGTAGSVRDCADFIENADFLVISGDAACSFDLRRLMEKHRLSGAEATILTYESAEPLEYGLVLTDNDGAVRTFLEKPEREKLCTDMVNTGIYALSPGILADIPDTGAYDFGAELFPALLRQGRRILTYRPEGYWNDVGSPAAYLQTCRDVLDGRFPLQLSRPIRQAESGPFWISPDAEVEPSAKLGPYAVVGGGSSVGEGCRIAGSVLLGSTLLPESHITGSILAEAAHIGRGVRIEDGAVIAEGAELGDGCVIRPGVRVCPGKAVPPGCIISEEVGQYSSCEPLHFSADGTICGEIGRDITPADLLRMGASQLPGSRIAAASAGGSAAELLAEAFLVGCGSTGRHGFLLDSSLPAVAAFAGEEYGMDMTLFASQSGSRCQLWFFDREGLNISRSLQRRLEAALSGTMQPMSERKCRPMELLPGTDELFLSKALSIAVDNMFSVSVPGGGLLKQFLLRAGLQLVPPADGVISFSLSSDGFALSAVDERGRSWEQSELLSAYAAVLFSSGESCVVLPADAPFAVEQIAQAFGGSICRLDECSPEEHDLLQRQPWSRNGCFLCLKLLSALTQSSGTVRLCDLMDALPRCYHAESILETQNSEISLLRRIAETEDANIRRGLYLEKDQGAVHLRRLDRNRIRIYAESCSAEMAAELCSSYRQKLNSYDERKDRH